MYFKIINRSKNKICGVGYNLGAACFGGTASLIGSGFVAGKGSEIGTALLGVWLSVLAVVAFSIIFCVGRKSGNRNGLNENETDASCLSGVVAVLMSVCVCCFFVCHLIY